MKQNILYILPSFNKYGGTPKKTLDLIKFSANNCFLYTWTNAYANEFKAEFVTAGATVFEGNYSKNILKHTKKVIEIVDKNNINIIQSQFFFGELLSGLVKVRRPKARLIIGFVGARSPKGIKQNILNLVYNKVDAFVYISNYVKAERIKVYPKLKQLNGKVIYNGTQKPNTNNTVNIEKKGTTILCVSGLSKIKNVQVLIDCMVILKQKGFQNITFIIAGDGPEKENFETQIISKRIESNFKFLGYQKNIGNLYKETDIFVHPCYIEGFGIAVAEAMLEEKPIVAANAGALPELITNKKTGLLAAPFNAQEWADAIIYLLKNEVLAKTYAQNAKTYAKKHFSVKMFVDNYSALYKSLSS